MKKAYLLLALAALPVGLTVSAQAAESSCESGDPAAYFESALNYHRANDFKNAHLCAQKACDANFAAACFYLGFDAQEHEKHADAVPYYEKACSHDYAMGCLALGNSYRLGLGVPASADRSKAYYRRACELGDATGCSHLKPHLGQHSLGMPHSAH